MARRNETKCKNPAWLDSPEKAEIDQLLRGIEKEEKERKMKLVTEVLKLIEKEDRSADD